MESKKLTIHQSTLATISRCGMQAYYRYVEKRRSPPGIAALAGTAVHKAVEHNLKTKMASGKLADIEDVRQLAAEAARGGFDSEVLMTVEEQQQGDALIGSTIDRVVRLASMHATEAAPHIEPTHIEQVFRLESGGDIALEGTVDVLEAARGVMRDTKTSGKSYAADAAANSVQKDFYAMMAQKHGFKIDKFKLDVLVGTGKKYQYQQVESPTPTDHEPLLRRIDAAVRVFESGAFMPADPTDWCCNPKWCGYWQICPYGERRRKQFAISEGSTNNEDS